MSGEGAAKKLLGSGGGNRHKGELGVSYKVRIEITGISLTLKKGLVGFSAVTNSSAAPSSAALTWMASIADRPYLVASSMACSVTSSRHPKFSTAAFSTAS